MNAIDLLKKDHETVRGLFEEFRGAKEGDAQEEMGRLAGKILTELETHTAIEEEVFYPAVREAGAEELLDLTDESLEEHHVVDVLMAEIRVLSPGDDSFGSKMAVLIENVEHHASEEESEMFPKLRSLFSGEKLDQLGSELEEAKHRHAVAAMTKDDLYEEARLRGIEGRAEMSKEELGQAIQDS